MKLKRLAALVMAAFMIVACLGACSSNGGTATQSTPLTVGSMKGATSIGLASLMQDQEQLSTPDYEFSVAANADELVPQVAAGDFDFALVPANLAVKLYNQTNGGIRVIGINTLGVLYGIAYDPSIKTINDLSGRTIYMTGKGSMPGYTVEYLVKAAGLTDEVTIEYKSEPSEALAALQNNHDAIAIVPEPFATASLTKDAELSRVLDITALWDESTAGGSAHGRFITGVTVARSELIDNNPEAVASFLEACSGSAQTAMNDPASIADTLVNLGILGNAKLADEAVPHCNIVCITGQEMIDDLSGFLEALYTVEPTAVGGELPGEEFYYIG